MQAPEAKRAVAAARSIASALDLKVGEAVVLQTSNKLVVRLLPCDVLARVAPQGQLVAQLEIEIAQLDERPPYASSSANVCSASS